MCCFWKQKREEGSTITERERNSVEQPRENGDDGASFIHAGNDRKDGSGVEKCWQWQGSPKGAIKNGRKRNGFRPKTG